MSFYFLVPWGVTLYVWDLPVFFFLLSFTSFLFLNVGIYCYELPSWNCFCCLPSILAFTTLCILSQSLGSHLLLDINIKGQMICDLLNPVGFVLPNTEDIILCSAASSPRQPPACLHLGWQHGQPHSDSWKGWCLGVPSCLVSIIAWSATTICPYTTATSVPLKACLISCSLAQGIPTGPGESSQYLKQTFASPASFT